jgi:ABC1 atypical kinase-like domain
MIPSPPSLFPPWFIPLIISSVTHITSISLSSPYLCLSSPCILLLSQVDNKAYLDQYGADKAAIVRNITRAFAHQIFVDGFYTADPHPGEGPGERRRQEKEQGTIRRGGDRRKAGNDNMGKRGRGMEQK